MAPRTIKILVSFAALIFAGPAFSAPITDLLCGGPDRYAEMDSAEACFFGAGNPKKGDLLSYSPGSEWFDVGRLEGTSSNGFLSWSFISGGWGNGGFSGTWTIDAAFWDMYSSAMITFHVGNGNGDPDHFAFLITEGDLTGVLTYLIESGRGGGFSNLVLWGRDPKSVPTPGTALLLGSGLLLLAARRRRQKQ